MRRIGIEPKALARKIVMTMNCEVQEESSSTLIRIQQILWSCLIMRFALLISGL